MRTAHAEWWPSEYETGEIFWWRNGTDRDPITLHENLSGSEFGIVIADTCAEAMRIDAEVFGEPAA